MTAAVAPDVVLLHYDDLSDDLAGEMRRLAEHLDIEAPEDGRPWSEARRPRPAARAAVGQQSGRS